MSKKSFLLTLSALGVVYGDIGTSPLYSVNEIFFGKIKLVLDKFNILGGISLVVWTLVLIICFKYVFLILQADSDGEGGVFALSSLIGGLKNKNRLIIMVSALLILAAGLLFGDGVITPAISVISAVEGLSILAPSLSFFVIPVTVLILTGLFAIQNRGTARVGSIFGPVITLWFFSIAYFGLRQIISYPGILSAFNPLYAVNFLFHTPLHVVFVVLGSVMLVVTGGEAMYADMGHFGRRPIRTSWFYLVFPALLINYLGQGAFLLSGKSLINSNIFYSMIPQNFLFPMIILATLATIIASQALISGAFSLASQAVALGLLPRLKIIQTHSEHEGQKYIPAVNWALYIGSVALVIFFRTSTNLASLYGFAVSGNMMITSLAFFIVSRYLWKQPLWLSFLAIGPFLVIDPVFFLANSLKITQGGYIPLMVAVILMVIMKIWNWGKSKAIIAEHKYPTMLVRDLVAIKKKSEESIPRTMVIMTPAYVEDEVHRVPALEQLFWDRYGMLPKNLIFLTIKQHKIPFMHHLRHEVIRLHTDPEKGGIFSVRMNFGFMEEPDVEKQLESIIRHHEINIPDHPDEILVQYIEDKMIIPENTAGFKQVLGKIFKFMDANAMSAVEYFGLSRRVQLSSEILQVRLH